jgi:ElaB/YqjD/DUF883 family membrane-anchored ribosome-binding protein
MAGAKNASAGSGSSTDPKDQQTPDVAAAATEVTDQIKGQVTGLGHQVREQANSQFATQKDKLVDALDTVSLVLRQSGEHADLQDKEMLSHYVDQASQKISQWSDSLRNQDMNQILDETKNLAQRQPLLFMGGALALGFAGARFFRSSVQPEQSSTSSTDSSDSSSPDKELTSGERSNSSTSSAAYSGSSLSGSASDLSSTTESTSTFGVLPDIDTAYGTDLSSGVGGYLGADEDVYIEGDEVEVSTLTNMDDFTRPERS